MNGAPKKPEAWSAGVSLVPIFLLLVAVLPLPYGYYTFLRIVIFLAAISLALQRYHALGRVGGLSIAFGLMAVLFNPVFPIHLAREIWIVSNFVGAAVFGLGFLLDRRA